MINTGLDNCQQDPEPQAGIEEHAQDKNGPASLLGVFPLPVFILPGGIKRLRIFEPRYLNMVSEATRGGGFVIARYDSDKPFNVPDWGTKVEIIDFDRDSDGLLIIDVLAANLVTLREFRRREDNLLMAQTIWKKHWSDKVSADQANPLGAVLSKLFANNTALAKLYPEPRFEQTKWVCARFLELLPLSLTEKERFILPDSFSQLETFLQLLILGQEKN